MWETHDEQVLFAVIGDAAVMIMVVGSFALPGAEDEPLDLNAGKITCRGLNVVSQSGGVHMQGGHVFVMGEDAKFNLLKPR